MLVCVCGEEGGGGGGGGGEEESVCTLFETGRERGKTISSETASECDAVGGNSCISLGRA